MEQAEKKYLKIKEKIVSLPQKEKFSILLKHGQSVRSSIELSLQREESKPNQNYIEYQMLLQKYIAKQVKRGLYDIVIQCDSLSPIQIQNKIRDAIRSKFPHLKVFVSLLELPKTTHHVVLHADYLLGEKVDIPAHAKIAKEYRLLYQLNKFLNAHYWIASFSLCGIDKNLQKKIEFLLGYKLPVVAKNMQKTDRAPQIVAFGGLSESGKSTFASMTYAQYKGKSTRLKIGYLLKDASTYKKVLLNKRKSSQAILGVLVNSILGLN